MSDKPLEGIDVVYWINLDRSIDRKERMLKMFNDPVFETTTIQRFSAIDGKREDINSMIYNKKKKLTKPEYGCLLSHLEIINEFSKTDYDIALIMEDDITLDFKKYWKKSIKQVISEAPKDWEIIMLCYHSDKLPVNLYTLNENNYWSTGAYLINNEAAKKLTYQTYISGIYHLDDNIKQAADDYLFIKLKTYVYKYPYFIYGYSENTTIPTSNVRYHNFSRKQVEYMYESELKMQKKQSKQKQQKGKKLIKDTSNEIITPQDSNTQISDEQENNEDIQINNENLNENNEVIENINEGFSEYKTGFFEFFFKYIILICFLIVIIFVINKLSQNKIIKNIIQYINK